ILPSASPAARAISVTVARSNPLRAKTRAAAARICVRRAPSRRALAEGLTRGIEAVNNEGMLTHYYPHILAACQGTRSQCILDTMRPMHAWLLPLAVLAGAGLASSAPAGPGAPLTHAVWGAFPCKAAREGVKGTAFYVGGGGLFTT